MGTQYCAPADIANAINTFSLQDVPLAQQVVFCQQASEKADSYLRGRFALPLQSFGTDVVYHVAKIAVYFLLTWRGYNPDANGDVYWVTDYKDAIRWFEGIQAQRVHPDVVPAVAQPGDPVRDLPQVFSEPQRGWQTFSTNGTPSVW